jgi:hypothetical protein
MSVVYSLGTNLIENTTCSSYSIVLCVSVTAEACSPSCSLATAVSPGSTILALSGHSQYVKVQ